MNKMIKLLSISIFTFIVTIVGAQENATPIINFSPNTNFFVMKIKNAKDLKTKLENHPLQKNIYTEKTGEYMEALLKAKQKDNEEPDGGDGLVLERKADEKMLSALNGEALLTISIENTDEAISNFEGNSTFTIIAQVDQKLFKEAMKDQVFFADKSEAQHTTTKAKHENISYVSIEKTKGADILFFATTNDIAVISNKQDNFFKILTAISKNATIENGLKSNEKVNNYFSKNENKDVFFTFDGAPLIKSYFKKQEGMSKVVLDILKAGQLFEAYGSFEMNEKADSFEFALKGLEEGFLQFATVSNNEFTPSPFIGAEISTYFRAFFSIPEFKKRMLLSVIKTNPSYTEMYQTYLSQFKNNYQVDMESFIDSIGDDLEGYSVLNKDGSEEQLFLNKLKTSAAFTSNLSFFMNSAAFKKATELTLAAKENKEGKNQYWSITSNEKEGEKKKIDLAIGTIDSLAFLTLPSSNSQKQIAQMNKTTESKLSGLPAFASARALYPSKIAAFIFSNTKDFITSFKTKMKEPQVTTVKLIPDIDKILKSVEEIKVEDFSNNISCGLWKETNQINFSIKLSK